MISVVGSSVDNWLQQCRNFEAAVMDRHRPDVDSDVQSQVQHLLQWKQKYIDVIRHALCKAINGVKRMTGERSRHFPCMMWLVYGGVDQTMVQATMNPVYQAVREENEGKNGQYHPNPTYAKHQCTITATTHIDISCFYQILGSMKIQIMENVIQVSEIASTGKYKKYVHICRGC